MLGTFPAPVLSLAPEAVKDLQGREAVYALWTLFTKCKDSLHDGHRLENISWRLWYRDMMFANQRPPYDAPTSLPPQQPVLGPALTRSDSESYEKRASVDGDSSQSSISDRTSPSGASTSSVSESSSESIPHPHNPQSDGGVGGLTSCDSPHVLLADPTPVLPVDPSPTNSNDLFSRSPRITFPRAANATPISVGKIIYDMLPSTTTAPASTPSLTSSSSATNPFPHKDLAPHNSPLVSPRPDGQALRRLVDPNIQMTSIIPSSPSASLSARPPIMEPSPSTSSPSILAPLSAPSQSIQPVVSCLPTPDTEIGELLSGSSIVPNSGIKAEAAAPDVSNVLPHTLTTLVTTTTSSVTHHPTPFPSPALSYPSPSREPSSPTIDSDSNHNHGLMNVVSTTTATASVGFHPAAYSGPPSPCLSDSYAQAHPAELTSSSAHPHPRPHPNTSSSPKGHALDRSTSQDKAQHSLPSDSESSENWVLNGNVSVVQLPPVPEDPEMASHISGQLDSQQVEGPGVVGGVTSSFVPHIVASGSQHLQPQQPPLPQPPRLVVVNPTPNPTPHPTPPATPLLGFGVGGVELRRTQYLALPGFLSSGASSSTTSSTSPTTSLSSTSASTSKSTNGGPTSSAPVIPSTKSKSRSNRTGSGSGSTTTSPTTSTTTSDVVSPHEIYATGNVESRAPEVYHGSNNNKMSNMSGMVLGHGNGVGLVSRVGAGQGATLPHPHLLPQQQQQQRPPHQLSRAHYVEEGWSGADDEGWVQDADERRSPNGSSSGHTHQHPHPHQHHNQNRHSISSTTSNHSHISHATSSDSSALTATTSTTNKTSMTTGTALTEDESYLSLEGNQREVMDKSSNDSSLRTATLGPSPPRLNPSQSPTRRNSPSATNKGSSPSSSGSSAKKKRNSAPPNMAAVISAFEHPRMESDYLGQLQPQLAPLSTNATNGPSDASRHPYGAPPLTAPPLAAAPSFPPPLSSPLVPQPGSASSSKSTPGGGQRKRHSFTASTGGIMRRASSGRSSSRSERSQSREPRGRGAGSAGKDSSSSTGAATTSGGANGSRRTVSHLGLTSLGNAANTSTAAATTAAVLASYAAGITGGGLKKGIVVGGGSKAKSRVLVNRATAAKASRQAAIRRENSASVLEMAKRREQNQREEDDDEDEDDEDEAEQDAPKKASRRKSDVISPTTVDDSIRAEVERVKERERMMAEEERIKALEALREEEKRKAFEVEKERLSLLEKQRAEEEEEKRRKEQVAALAAATTSKAGEGDAAGGVGGKRPVRFNIGSNSDDGSGVGSKSTGSGSDVSGGRRSLGVMGNVLQQQQQDPSLLHATIMKGGTDQLLATNAHTQLYPGQAAQGIGHPFQPPTNLPPLIMHTRSDMGPQVQQHQQSQLPPAPTHRPDSQPQQSQAHPYPQHSQVQPGPGDATTTSAAIAPGAAAVPSIPAHQRRQMSKQQLHQLQMLEQLNMKHHYQGQQQRSMAPPVPGAATTTSTNTLMATMTTTTMPPPQPQAQQQTGRSGGGKAAAPPATHAIGHQKSASSTGSKDKGKGREHGGSSNKLRLDPELLAKVAKSLADPLLPQNKRTIVIATSESDFETDSEDDGSWSSEDLSTEAPKIPSQVKEVDDARLLQQKQQQRQQQALEQQRLQQQLEQQRQLQQQQLQRQLQQQQQQQQQLHQHPARPAGPQRTHSSHYPTTNHNRAKQARLQQHQQRLAHAHDLEAAAREAQRQRDMFTKLPRESFENLAKARTQSVGLLTQLLNPNPEIFPPNHPYRRGFSSGEIRPSPQALQLLPANLTMTNAAQQQQPPATANGASAHPPHAPPPPLTVSQQQSPRPQHRQPPSPLGLTHNSHPAPQERDEDAAAAAAAKSTAPLEKSSTAPPPADPTPAPSNAPRPSTAAPTSKHQKAPSLTRKALSPPVRAPSFTFSKSTAALPVSSQVAVGSVSGVSRIAAKGDGGRKPSDNGPAARHQPIAPSVGPALLARANGSNGHGGGGGSGGYRPRGPPQDLELSDESDTDTENLPAMSKSLAQEKLEALAAKRGIRTNQSGSGSGAQPQGPGAAGAVDGSGDGSATVRSSKATENEDDVPVWARVAPGPTRLHQQHRSNNQSQGSSNNANGQTSHPQPQHTQHTHTPVAIPLGHPYNLPPAAPPSTPRTTRRRMLSTEMPEDLRLNLLWERRMNRPTVRRTASSGGNRHSTLTGLQPLTTVPSMVQIQPKGTANQNGQVEEDLDHEEKRRRAMARNRSWANDFHYSGW